MRLGRRPSMLAAAVLLATGITALSAVSASAQTHAPKPALAARASQTHAPKPTSTAQAPLSPGLKALAEATCPLHAFCTWKDVGFSNTQWNYNADLLPTAQWLYVGQCSTGNCSGANDNISSVFNQRTNITYVGKNFPNSGNSTCTFFAGGDGDANFFTAQWPDASSMENSISSVRLSLVQTPVPNFCTLFSPR